MQNMIPGMPKKIAMNCYEYSRLGDLYAVYVHHLTLPYPIANLRSWATPHAPPYPTLCYY